MHSLKLLHMSRLPISKLLPGSGGVLCWCTYAQTYVLPSLFSLLYRVCDREGIKWRGGGVWMQGGVEEQTLSQLRSP